MNYRHLWNQRNFFSLLGVLSFIVILSILGLEFNGNPLILSNFGTICIILFLFSILNLSLAFYGHRKRFRNGYSYEAKIINSKYRIKSYRHKNSLFATFECVYINNNGQRCLVESSPIQIYKEIESLEEYSAKVWVSRKNETDYFVQISHIDSNVKYKLNIDKDLR